jgi:MoxR-like ATPase
MSKIKQVVLNTTELKDFVKHIVGNNRYLQENGKNPVAINIEGEAGLGKTSAILQVADELGLQCIKLNLSQLEEIGDLVGFPMKEHEMTKADITKWVTESTMPMYISSGYKPTGEKRMTHAAPEWVQGKKEGGILILDDWTRADIRFVQAVMEIIDRQEYISWKLPKDWHVILTSNPDNGEYLVNSIDTAQRTRFITAHLKFDIGFINNRLDAMVSPKEILTGADWNTIEAKLKASMYEGTHYRADIASLMATRISNYSIVYAESNPVTDKIMDRIKDIIKSEELFALDLHYFMIKNIISGNKSKFQKMLLDKDIVKLAVK